MLTSQSLLIKGEKSLLDEQRSVHSSGLLFGYAADRCTEPDWLVLPDGSQPNAWRLLHAARKGGDRFCVGSYSRYTPGQADDAAKKAKEYQFESLHKTARTDWGPSEACLEQGEVDLRGSGGTLNCSIAQGSS